jgi:hypothetical protein
MQALSLKTRTNDAVGMENLSFGMKVNAISFFATMSGLAKDKIGYPLRELCTNAWDVARGDFDVYLPTTMKPEFRVRDRGPGMSHDQVVEYAFNMFSTSKAADENAVGGWGAGMKSPFAYLLQEGRSGTYMLSSYQGGEKRTYVVSMGADGMPVPRQFPTVPTTEPDGFEIGFAVHRSDIFQFGLKAKEILWSFEPRPRIFPAADYEEPEVLRRGEGWTQFASHSVPFYGPQVRMGCVMYPFDINALDASDRCLIDSSDCTVIDAPIGSLSVTLSREALSYDNRTKATLQALVEKHRATLISTAQAAVDSAPTYFEACRDFNKTTAGLALNVIGALRGQVGWRGRGVVETLVLGAKKMMLEEGWTIFTRLKDERQISTTEAIGATVVIQHSSSQSLPRMLRAGLQGKKVLWVRAPKAAKADVLAAMGNPDHIVLEEFKLPKRVIDRTSTIRKKQVVVLHGQHTRLELVEKDIDLGLGGFVIQLAGGRGRNRYWKLNPFGSEIGAYTLESLLSQAVKWGVIADGTQVLVVRNSLDLPAIGEWTWLKDTLVEGFKSKIDPNQPAYSSRPKFDSLSAQAQSLFTFRDELGRAPQAVRDAITAITALRSVSQGATDKTISDRAADALASLGVSITRPTVDSSTRQIEAAVSDIAEAHPLLLLILKHHNYSDSVSVRLRLRALDNLFDLMENANDPQDHH